MSTPELAGMPTVPSLAELCTWRAAGLPRVMPWAGLRACPPMSIDPAALPDAVTRVNLP